MIKLRIYDLMERLAQGFVAPLYRNAGKALAQTGQNWQMGLTSDDRIVPSLRCRPANKQYPALGQADFIAPNSTVIGNVNLGEQSSIWYGATLRGELANIKIGNQSVIQDLVSIYPQSNKQVQIGDNVYVGSNSTLESCTLENNAFVGMGATISSGAKVESFGVVAAGGVVTPGTVVKSNQIWAGSPAVYLRDITPEEKQVISEHHQETVYLARIHAEETEKSFRQIVDDKDAKNTEKYDDSETLALKKMKELGFPLEFDDEDYIEQRVFLKKPDGPKESEFWNKQYDSFEQDLFHFPDSFKMYSENYGKYEEIKEYFDKNPNVEAQGAYGQEFEYPTNNENWTRKF